MKVASGNISLTYDGKMQLETYDLHAGSGLVIYPSRIDLDPDVIDMLGIQIIKEELKNIKLDLNKVNKMLEGSKEDKQIAYALLETQSKYIVPIHRALIMNDQYAIMEQVRQYRRNNLKLSMEIL